MVHVIDELKAHARILHRSARAKDPAALARLRALPELSRLEEDELAQSVRRRHALSALARELGFRGWPHAATVLGGGQTDDFGTLLCPPECAVHWNVWSASYEEARGIRAQNDGYLLAYRHHFFVVDRHFITTLGLDPDDPDWERLGRDWVRPADVDARARLYAGLIHARLPRPG